jgi:hypothetical protein
MPASQCLLTFLPHTAICLLPITLLGVYESGGDATGSEGSEGFVSEGVDQYSPFALQVHHAMLVRYLCASFQILWPQRPMHNAQALIAPCAGLIPPASAIIPPCH